MAAASRMTRAELDEKVRDTVEQLETSPAAGSCYSDKIMYLVLIEDKIREQTDIWRKVSSFYKVCLWVTFVTAVVIGMEIFFGDDISKFRLSVIL